MLLFFIGNETHLPLGFTQTQIFWEDFVFCPKERFGATLITFVGTNLQLIKKKSQVFIRGKVFMRESERERERERERMIAYFNWRYTTLVSW